MEDVLLDIHQAAEILGLNPETLRRWDRSGILKAVRLGNRGDRRYKREDIDRILTERGTKNADPQNPS